MGERRRRNGAGRPVMTRPKSTFTDFTEDPVETCGPDGVWRTAPQAPKAQLEELSDGSALYFVLNGRRVAYRHNKQWVPMQEGIGIADDAPAQGTLQ